MSDTKSQVCHAKKPTFNSSMSR